MFLVQWFIIDWLTVLPIIIIILLLIILLMRFIRRLTRWGPVKISHIQEKIFEFHQDQIPIYQKICPSDPLHPEIIPEMTTLPKIIYVPSLFAWIKHKNHVASALALLGYDVLVLYPDQVAKWHKRNENLEDLKEFFKEIQPKAVILLDYAIPLFFSIIQGYRDQIPWILIRPTKNWKDIRPIISFLPGSPRWFSKIALFIYQIRNKIPNSSLDSKLNESNETKTGTFQGKISLIHPEQSWLSPKALNDLKSWILNTYGTPKDDIHFSQGGWSFYRQETVLFGIISRILPPQ